MTYFQQPLNYILVDGACGNNQTAIDLSIVKNWLKIPSSLAADNSLLISLTKAAQGYFEKITGRDLITKTYKTYLDRFPFINDIEYYSGVSNLNPKYNNNGIVIRKSKLQSVTSIDYYVDGVLTAWDSSNYYFTIDVDYSAIYLVEDKEFPTEIDTRKQAVVITFTAGYGTSETAVPEDIKQALLQFISYLYENRGDCSDSSTMDAAMQLFSQFKIVDF